MSDIGELIAEIIGGIIDFLTAFGGERSNYRSETSDSSSDEEYRF